MSKTQKELAFLRDLSVDEQWTARFTDNFDKNYKFTDEESILYINAGTGNHVLALREKLDNEVEIFGVTEDEELTVIAMAKAKAIQANVGFSTFEPADQYDLVIADASFVKPSKVSEFLNAAIELSEEKVVFFLPTAGSFGEIFSMLWEALISENLIERSGEAERLIKEIPSVSDVEEIAKKAGFKKLQTKTEVEVFEFENGVEFIDSMLVSDFLMPNWFDFLDEAETAEVKKNLVKIIDENRDNMSFRFTVKATMVGGKKS